jgi:hypothetical protein
MSPFASFLAALETASIRFPAVAFLVRMTVLDAKPRFLAAAAMSLASNSHAASAPSQPS